MNFDLRPINMVRVSFDSERGYHIKMSFKDAKLWSAIVKAIIVKFGAIAIL